MEPDRKTYRIGELCERTGVTRRTVHYYIGRGLLPPAEGAGLASCYTEEHVERIRAIRRMQADYLPLEEIRRRLDEGEEPVDRAPEDVPAGRPGGNAERRLVRVVLEHGVEITYPDTEEAAEFAAKLVRLADRLGKES